jgi:FtsH-binding integral membrane protein
MRRELPGWSGLLMMGWLTVVLWLDRAGGGGGLWQQRGLGVVTWVLLLVALSRVGRVVRAQTLVVVAFATLVEYVFSPTLEVYTYRFDNVPAFVPPGHGLVYL